MESITYEIDPGGNIELVLNKPNDQNIIPCLQLSTDTLDTDPHDTRFENPSCRGRYAVFENLYATTETLTNTEVRFRVSSRHLILASHFFRAMLEGPWMEGTSSSQPLRQINATGWDAMAFAIVLDAIHGRHREIPYELTLGLVTRIATVIDYYGCHEAMYVYFDKWLNQNSLVNTSLSVLRKETLLCLYVSWVFSADATFILLARLVFRHSEGLSRIDTSDVPLGGILGKITFILLTRNSLTALCRTDRQPTTRVYLLPISESGRCPDDTAQRDRMSSKSRFWLRLSDAWRIDACKTQTGLPSRSPS